MIFALTYPGSHGLLIQTSVHNCSVVRWIRWSIRAGRPDNVIRISRGLELLLAISHCCNL